ncbi:cation:proton antiporter [Marinimicrobium sp. ABcell2]|uniref:cation:proton antiporter n=1 Tax=Marinimicrobium sp. ABcell2 TaxID=3069751 RepID=UPI0027B499A0|nr:cation:proton antiporter [Marinimicrobium sp. ABcell2]MDQ2076296.1 cation:proton antiporter [Marinimicrobium sp. ABcell2]
MSAEWLSQLPVDVTPAATNMVLLGAILSLSILADAVSSHTRLPRISLLVLIGVAVAVVQQLVLGMPADDPLGGLSEPLIELALVMVAFLLGSELTVERLRSTGPLIGWVSLTSVVVCGGTLALGLLLLGFPLVVVVALAAISVTTGPAVVSEMIHRRGDDRLRAQVLMGSVALCDAWGIILFGLAMAWLGWLINAEGHTALIYSGWELGGALLLGGLVGAPAAWLTGRLKPGEPTQVEAIALMLLLSGLSSWLGVSALLAGMTAGVLVVNLSTHHTRSFKEIEHIEWPFLVFFFVLSGAAIDLYELGDALGLTLAYIVLRLVGRYLGGWLGVRLIQKRGVTLPRDLGLALTPQAGVAMGMALLVADRFPEYATVLLTVIIASTVIFEIIGPLMVNRVLRQQ